jgi:hypothetical protein
MYDDNDDHTEKRDLVRLSEQVREIITMPNTTQRRQAHRCSRAFVLRQQAAPDTHEPHSASQLLGARALRIVTVTAPRSPYKASSVKHTGSMQRSPQSRLAGDSATQTCCGEEAVDNL